MLRIYLTNLGKYNEGFLIGEWVELPVSDEELHAVYERIGINEQYEEWFITDYESDVKGFTVDEYESIDTLNEEAEFINNLTEDEALVFESLINDGYSYNDSKEKTINEDYRIFDNCNDMTDVAYQVVEECGYLDNVPENIARYFDYEAFGRDLELEGYSRFIFTESGDCVQIML